MLTTARESLCLGKYWQRARPYLTPAMVLVRHVEGEDQREVCIALIQCSRRSEVIMSPMARHRRPPPGTQGSYRLWKRSKPRSRYQIFPQTYIDGQGVISLVCHPDHRRPECMELTFHHHEIGRPLLLQLAHPTNATPNLEYQFVRDV